MRRYETIFITLAELSADETEELIERYRSIVTFLEGSMIKIEKWGKRKLAYPIEKRKEGFYVLFDFGGESKVVSEVERNFKIDDKVIRFQTVKIADSISPEEIEKELAESKRKAEEEARRREEAEARRREEAEARKREAAAAVSSPEEKPDESVVEETEQVEEKAEARKKETAAAVPPAEEKPDESIVEKAEKVEEEKEEEKVTPETEPAETEVEEEKKEEGGE
ncbi:MAG: 30S ribosomal protein S6 [Thermodesulfobacteriota bacterium]|nr:30S ribosomal protein S6 [Thermodesulfobacteriota bacterium]